MAETVSVITLQGKDELSKVLTENNKQFKSFGTTTKETEKQLNVFNKSITATKEGFEGVTKNSKEAIGSLKGLNYGFKSSYNDSVAFGSNLIKTSDTVTDLTTGFKGLALGLTGAKDKFTLLGDAIGGPANELRAIAESRDNTERFFNVLTRVSKPVSATFTNLGDKASIVNTNLAKLEKGTLSLSKSMSNAGASGLNMFSNAFSKLAESIEKRGGLFSGAIANTFAGIGDAAQDASKEITRFNKSLGVKDLNEVDKAGISLAKTFGGLEQRFNNIAQGVEAADFIGNIYLGLRSAQDFVNEGLIPTAIAAKDAGQAVGTMGIEASKAVGPMSTIGTIAGLIKDAFRGMKRGMLEVLAQFDDIAMAATVFTLIVNGAKSAKTAFVDLNTAMGVMQGLGFSTYAMEVADSIGLIGENLIFSTSAAKEFGQAAVIAFAQFEDAASFITTLTSGEAFRFGNANAGIDSISAAMNELVNGPMKNMVTSVEASNSLYNALSAGIGITAGKVDEFGRSVANTNELLSFMTASLKLSSATGTDAASSMEVLSKVTEVYNLSNLQASETAAKLNAVVENGVTTFPQLVGGLSRTASVAASAGVSIDELFGSIGALTRVMTTQDVLTGYTSLISAIAGQGSQAQKAVKELGIQFNIQSVKSEGLLVSLQKLNEATNGNIEKLKEIIPDQLAFQTAQTLMNTSMEDAVEIMGKVSQANEGSLEQIFSNRSQSMIKRMSALTNGFNEVLIEFGQKALPMIEPGLVFMEQLLATINSLPDPIKNMIGAFVLFHAGLSRVVDTTLSLVTSFVQISATLIVFRLMSSAMKSLGNVASGAVEKRGGLKDFIGIFKYLLFEEKNIIGAYAHITGINRKFQQQLIETTKALSMFETVQKRTAKAFGEDRSFDIQRGDIEGYIAQLKRIRELKKEAEGRAREIPGIGLEDRVKELKALENDYIKLIKQERLSRKELFEEGNRATIKAMRDAGQNITQMRQQLVKNMAQSFSSFDDVTVKEMTKFSAIVERILERQELSSATKLAAIKQLFREVLKGVPEANRAEAQKIIDVYTDHMSEMEGLPKKFKTKVVRAYMDLVQALPMEARQELSDADKIGLEFISDLTQPIETRKDEVKKLVQRLVQNLPSEISSYSAEMQKAFEDLITPDPTNLDFREGAFRQKIKKLIKEMGDSASNEVKDEVIQLQKALLEFSRVFNEPPKTDKALWARIFSEQGKQAITTIDQVFTRLSAEFDEFTEKVNSDAKANGGSVKAYFESLKNATKVAATGTKEEVEKELKKVEQAYQNIDIEDDTVKAKLKRYYQDLVQGIKDAGVIEQLNVQKNKLINITSDIRSHLENVSSADVKTNILKNFLVIENALKKGIDNLSSISREDLDKLKQETEQALEEYADKLSPQEQTKLRDYLALLSRELETGFTQAKNAAKQGIDAYTSELERVNRTIEILNTEVSNFGDLELVDEDLANKVAARLQDAVRKIEAEEPEIKQSVEQVNNLISNIADPQTQQELAENLTKAQVELAQGLTEVENTVEPEKRTAKLEELSKRFKAKLKALLEFEDIKGKGLTKLDDILNSLMSKEDAEKVIKEYSAKVNEELAKIADEDLRKELEENLIKAQATFERRLQKIEDSVEPEKRTQQVRILVANFNHEIRKIAADGDIEQDIEASFEKVQKVVDRKINEITDATHQAVQQQKEKGSRMGDIGESLLYSISSLAGVDIGPIGDIIDVARDAGDAYDELTDSVDANRVSNEKNKRAVIGVWGARKEELATLKETGQSQNYLVASLNVLGAAYENIFIWLSKKVGLDKLYVKLGWMKAQATTANTTAETANTVAVTGNTLAQKVKLALTKLSVVWTNAQTIATNIQSGAVWLLNAAWGVLGATLTALYGSVLMPVLVTLGVLAVSVGLLAKALGFLPGPLEKTRRGIEATREELDKLTEAQNRNQASSEDYTEKLVKTVEAHRAYKHAISVQNKALEEGDSQLSAVTKSMLSFRNTQTEAAGQVQGLGSGLVWLFDVVLVNGARILGWVGNIIGGVVEGLGWLISKIPGLNGVGEAFKQLGQIMHTVDDVAIKVLRNGFNDINRSLTAVNEATREAIRLHQELTDEVLRASRVGEGEMSRGEAASEEGKKILEAARNRSLSVEEMQRFQQEEQKFVENEKELIQSRIGNLDKEIEDLNKRYEKKGRLTQNEQARLDALQAQRKDSISQITDLEEADKRNREYQENLNAMMLALEENNASLSIMATNQKVAKTYQELPDAAKKAYAEILGLQITTVEENGEQVSVAIQKDYDLFNRGQRQKYLAFTGAMADVANNVKNATDINSQETLGELQDDIFNFAESAQEMLAAGFDPEKVLADFKGGLEAFRIQFKEKGMTDEQMDLLDAAGQEALMNLLFEMYEATSKKIIDANKHQIDVISIQNDMGIGNQIENLKKIQELNQANAEEEIKLNEKKLSELEEAGLQNSTEYINLQHEIALQEMQLDKMVFDNKLSLLDEELKIFKDAQTNKIDILRVQNELNRGDTIENITKLNALVEELAQKEIEINRRKLATLAVGSEDYLNLQREIALQEISFTKLTLDNKVKVLEEQNKIVEKRIQNEIAGLKNIAEAEIQVLDLQQKRQEFNTKLLESRNAVISAIEDYEVSALENINKLETDISEKAENQLEIFIKQGEAQERAREFEILSLENQQRGNEIALLRERTTIRIGQAEARLAVIQAQNALAQAKVMNARKEELEGLQLAIEASQLTLESYNQQTLMLEEQAAFQEEMIENERIALQARQQAQKETYATDLILEQNRVALAAYDEQISKIQNKNQIERITSEIQIQRKETENSLLENQLNLLKQQQDFVKSANDSQQDAYSLAISMAKSEYQRRKLEEEAAKARLKNLQEAQKAEERIFELNQKQQKLALEISVLKSDAAASQANAELQVARAEAQKVMADVTATQEQKAAALASVQAAEATLQSAQMQQIITREQQNVFLETSELQRKELERQQEMAELQARSDVAKTTRTRGDDNRVQAEALAIARGRTQEEQREFERRQRETERRDRPSVEEQRRQDEFAERQAAILSRTISQEVSEVQKQMTTYMVEAERRSLESLYQNSPSLPTTPTNLTPETLSGMIDINLNLTVDGDTSNIDTEGLNKTVSDVVYNGLFDLFEDMRRGR